MGIQPTAHLALSYDSESKQRRNLMEASAEGQELAPVTRAEAVPSPNGPSPPANEAVAAQDARHLVDDLSVTMEDLSDLDDMVISDDLRLDLYDDSYETALRLRTDCLLLEELRASSFNGRLYDAYRNELARYGLDVLAVWIRSGKIARMCREKGRPVTTHELRSMSWEKDELAELAIETVSYGLHYFFNKVLQPGRWKPERGATLKTFFLGSCVLQFPNAYQRWLNESYQWRQMVDSRVAVEDVYPCTGQGDQTADFVLDRQTAKELLDSIPDPQTRAAAHLVMWGYTYAEAGAQVGLSDRALEGRFRRIRAKPRRPRTETPS
ncbi:hypothetical protein ACFVU0_34510 [Streptomyces sp. NPDC058122]|uniref:hypothetical protein n=1 Tax=Streptomyces sp. NPDC058122 TaxID=3346349 RepID=UPI0036E42844